MQIFVRDPVDVFTLEVEASYTVERLMYMVACADEVPLPTIKGLWLADRFLDPPGSTLADHGVDWFATLRCIAGPCNDQRTIRIRMHPDGRTIALTVTVCCWVWMLKDTIQTQVRIPVDQQRLTWHDAIEGADAASADPHRTSERLPGRLLGHSGSQEHVT